MKSSFFIIILLSVAGIATGWIITDMTRHSSSNIYTSTQELMILPKVKNHSWERMDKKSSHRFRNGYDHNIGRKENATVYTGLEKSSYDLPKVSSGRGFTALSERRKPEKQRALETFSSSYPVHTPFYGSEKRSSTNRLAEKNAAGNRHIAIGELTFGTSHSKSMSAPPLNHTLRLPAPEEAAPLPIRGGVILLVIMVLGYGWIRGRSCNVSG